MSSISGLMSRLNLGTAANATTTTIRNFSTSSSAMARQAVSTGPPIRKKHAIVRTENWKRLKVLRKNMFTPAPPPLRMARSRHVRHWTIHRAWQLFRRNQHLAIEQERMRMHDSMYKACEELRLSAGPGERSEGYLYRVAMEKKGVWGTDAIPIEYARFQTDSPAKQAWNHDWKRS